MSKKSFLILCAATVVAVLVAFIAVLSQPRLVSHAPDREPIFPNLVKDAASLKSVVIHHGGETTSLDWDGKVWRDRERDGFPADVAKITNLVVRLAQMAKLEPKTKQPDRYSRLDLADPNAKDGKGHQILLIDGTGKEIVNVIVGKTKPGAGGQEGGTYIRLPSDPQTWLASGELSLGESGADWLPRDVIDIPDRMVKRVTVTHPNGEKIVAFKNDPNEENYSVENQGRGVKLPDPSAADTNASVLTGFSFDDVVPAAKKPFPQNKTTNVVVEGFAGFKVSLDILTEDENAWVKVQGTPPAPRATPAAPEGVQVTDLRNDWNKAMADLNAKANGWAFRVSADRVEAVTRRMPDLMKKPEAPTPGGRMPPGMPPGFPPGAMPLPGGN